jgi:aminopeptidase
MADPRVQHLARTLVRHSIKARPGERVLVSAESTAAPLVREVMRELLRVGALPAPLLSVPGTEEIFFAEASEAQLRDVAWTELMYANAAAMIVIDAKANTRALTNVDPEKQRIRREARREIQKFILEDKVRWVLTQFPCDALAMEADMSLEEFEDFLYSATNIDHAALEQSMRAAADRFDAASEVRVIAPGTDVTIDIAGRKGVLCAGSHNVPDGEFFYTPNHIETRGEIFYEWPTIFQGQEVSGIRLCFEAGKVVEASAKKGEAALLRALDTDKGSRYLGELGIGCNFGITRPTRNILFDEKIGGSVHLALGASYPNAGKGNESALHWDMVKNLRDGGRIELDGVLVQENGKWCF